MIKLFSTMDRKIDTTRDILKYFSLHKNTFRYIIQTQTNSKITFEKYNLKQISRNTNTKLKFIQVRCISFLSYTRRKLSSDKL